MTMISCQESNQDELVSLLNNEESPFTTTSLGISAQESVTKLIRNTPFEGALIANKNWNMDNVESFEMIPTHEKRRNHVYKLHVIPSKENDKDGPTTYYYLLEYDGKISWAYTALIENINKSAKKISYSQTNGNIFFIAEINSTRQEILNKVSYREINQRVEALTRSEFPYDGIGDCTAQCIADAYTDNGWWSVALGLVTADTGLGAAAVVAAYCAAACLDCRMFGLC
jgi:hypothetical protein